MDVSAVKTNLSELKGMLVIFTEIDHIAAVFFDTSRIFGRYY